MFEDQQRKPTGVRGAQRAPDFSGPAVQPRALPPRIVTPQLQRQAQVGQQLAAHTFRPMALQRQQVGPVLEASSLQREVDEGLQLQRQVLQAQVSQSRMSDGAIEGALERQAARYAPVPALRQAPAGPADWVQTARVEVQRVTDPSSPGQTRWLSGVERERHLGSLRSVSQGLAQGFKADRGLAVQRYAEYGEQLATLQRQPLTGSIPRMVLAQVSPAERPLLQRAVDEALQRHAEQEAQDQSALNQHALQRQLAELDHQAERPILERIQARRGGGAPLPAAVQRQLEVGLNHDLSGVRVHIDGEADLLSKKVNAVAFTTGQDIYFQSGRFDPNSRSGIELLAHEATHTVQQSRGQVGKGIDPDAGLEQEARSMGHKIAHVLPSSKSLMPPSPHAPGVYSQKAALQRTQDGAAGYFALKPLYDLQPHSVQRAPLGDLTLQRFDLNPLHAIEKGASALANKAKDAAMSAVKAIPGYKELSMAFGKDLVTGSGLGGSPEAILNALANWVPGPLKDIIRALKETNVIGKAWDWFKGQLGKLDLGGVLGEVKDAVFKLPPDLGQAKSAVTRRVSGLMNLIKGSAQKIAEIGLTALTAGLGPLGKTIMASLKGAGDVIVKVLKDPVAFAKHLVEAVKGGFQKFAGNAPKHLQNGIGQWLTGSSGITFPSKFDLEGVFMVALSVMGLTYQNLRGKLVRALGPGGSDKVSKAETTIDTLKSVKGGLQHASEVKGQQGSVGTAIQDGIKSEVTKSLVVAGIQKVVTMLIPGGGFINAIIGAFQTVQTVIQQGAQIAQVVTSALGSIGAIAAGNIGSAVGLIDRTLGGAIPVALAWLGKVVGIGNIGSKVKSVILKVRTRLDSVVDKLVGKVKGLIDKLFGKGKDTAPKKAGETQADIAKRNKELPEKEKAEKLDKAANSIRSQIKPLLDSGIEDRLLNQKLKTFERQFDLTGLKVVQSGGAFDIVATVNPSRSVLTGYTPQQRDILRVANEVGATVMADPRVRAAAQHVAQQRQDKKGDSATNQLLVPQGGHVGAASDLRDTVAARTAGQQTFYDVNTKTVKHTQSRRNPSQTVGTLEVKVTGGGSYPDIQATLEKLTEEVRSRNPAFTSEQAEREVAAMIRRGAQGRTASDVDHAYSQHVAEITHLLFTVEPARNNSAVAFSTMLLDNVSSGTMKFKDAFTGRADGRGLFPPSQIGAVSAMNRIEQESQLDDATLDEHKVSRNAKWTEQRDRQLEFCRRWIEARMGSKKMDFGNPAEFSQYVTTHFKTDLLAAVLRNLR